LSRSIRNVIKKRALSYKIQRYDRDNGYYDEDDGIWVDSEEIESTVKIHLQPVVDRLTDGVEGQRQEISWHGWAIESETVANKDRVTIDDGIFTIANLVHWPGDYREFDLIRSGEADNLDDN